MIRRIARPMLASVFIKDGIETLRNPQPRIDSAAPMVDKAAPLVEKGEAVLAEKTSVSFPPIPKSPSTLVKTSACIKIAAGSLFALGKLPRFSAAALVVTQIPTTAVRNDFWAENDKDEKSKKMRGFATDAALLGAISLATLDREGRPGLSWRAKKAAAKVSGTSSALSQNASKVAETAREKAPEYADRARELAEVAGVKSRELADVAREKAPEYVEAARTQAVKIGETAREKAPELADTARARADKVAGEGSRITKNAAKKAEEARRKVEENSPNLSKKAKKAAIKASKSAAKAAATSPVTKLAMAGKLVSKVTSDSDDNSDDSRLSESVREAADQAQSRASDIGEKARAGSEKAVKKARSAAESVSTNHSSADVLDWAPRNLKEAKMIAKVARERAAAEKARERSLALNDLAVSHRRGA